MSTSIISAQPGLPGILTLDVPPALQARALRVISEPFSDALTAPAEIIEAAREWLPKVRAAMVPASDAERVDQLNALADHPGWRPPALEAADEKRKAIFWAAYHSDLMDVPAFALAEACKRAREDEHLKRFPRSGELLSYARRCERWRDGLKVAEGLRRLSLAYRERARSAAPVSSAEWDEVQRRIAELRDRIGRGAGA